MSLHLTYETVGHASHGANQKIHAVLFLPRHEPLAVSETCESLYTSIDLAAKELERQVRRYREKMQGKQRAR
jgi:ribosomal subunit interface protein